MSQGLDTFGCLNNTIKVHAGHYVDLVSPAPETIEIYSISAALSKICRFGGHCPQFYTVAEHCVHATRLAETQGVKGKALLAILLHDAAEAYIGDMVKPLKMTIPQYAYAEQRMERAIEKAFDIQFDHFSEIIKLYDRAMLKVEKTTMWPEDKEEWAGFSQIPTADVDLQYWDPETARQMYLYMFYVASP
jgi:uncharacterized protein